MSQCTVGQYGGSPGHLLTCSLLNLRGMEDRENCVPSLEAKHQKSATRSWSFFLSNGYQKKSVMTTWLTPRIGPQCSSDRRDNLIRLDIPASRTIAPLYLFRLWIHLIISPVPAGLCSQGSSGGSSRLNQKKKCSFDLSSLGFHALVLQLVHSSMGWAYVVIF